MTPAKQYCKAYHLADLRRFPGWTDRAGPDTAALADNTVVYLWDDLTVVTNPVVPDGGVLAGMIRQDSDWERFCREELEFQVPED